MIKRRRFPKVFFGWWTVIASGIISFWGTGYSNTAASALFKPIASELGLGRAVTSVAASIARFEGGFESPVTGWLTDRFGPRWVVTFGVFLIGLGLVLMNYVDSLWAYYLVWGGIVGTGHNIGLTIPLDKAISNWFVKKRGLAISTKWMFSGFCPVLVLPLVAWLIIIHGWRMTCVIGGVVMWLVGLPLAWFFVKQHRPEYYGLLPDGATVEEEATEVSRMIDRGVEYATEVEEVEFTLRQAIRTPAYWLLIASRAAQSMVTIAIIIHCIPFLTDMGIDPLVAAVIISMTSIARIPARFISGLIADRIKKDHLRFLLAGTYLLQAAGITAFLLNQTMPMIYVFFILYNLGMGMSLPINTVMSARYFGRKAFGSIRGSSMIFITPIGAIAPIYAGWIYDTTGSYVTAFTLFAVLLALAVVVISLTFPPKPPAQITDIRKIV
ncbi:MFS transporter [Chloroflexota bacterium]